MVRGSDEVVDWSEPLLVSGEEVGKMEKKEDVLTEYYESLRFKPGKHFWRDFLKELRGSF